MAKRKQRTREEYLQTYEYILRKWNEMIDQNGEDVNNPSDRAEQFLAQVLMEVFKDEEEWGENIWSQTYKQMVAEGLIVEETEGN